MENFVAFLRDNWKFLLEIFVPLVSLVILCFVRKTKVNIPGSVISELFVQVPGWILQAESDIGSGKGQEKLKYVFAKCVDFLSDSMDLSTSDIIKFYGESIVAFIEDVLNTPQKKGDQ